MVIHIVPTGNREMSRRIKVEKLRESAVGNARASTPVHPEIQYKPFNLLRFAQVTDGSREAILCFDTVPIPDMDVADFGPLNHAPRNCVGTNWSHGQRHTRDTYLITLRKDFSISIQRSCREVQGVS